MTLSQIILRAMRMLDEDPQDIDEFHDLFMAYANEGYRIAVTQYVKPRRKFFLKTDENGRSRVPAFDITRLVRIEDEDGRDVWFDLSQDGEQVITRLPKSNLTALCEISYPDMERDEEEPQIPVSLHAALADYICFRYLSTGNLAKQSRAQAWSTNFYRTMQMVRPQGMGSVTRLQNLYAVTQANYRE